jgi:D-threonate/D-erythronate kinase
VTDWVIIADDLTGAADAAVAFAASADTRIAVDSSAPWPTSPVISVNLETRYLDAASAGLRAHEAMSSALQLSGARVFYKVDSLLRGNPAAEIAGALRAVRELEASAFAVVAPAFPAVGRATVQGALRLSDPDAGPSVADREGTDIAEVLRVSGLRTLVITRPEFTDAASVADRLRVARESGTDAVVVDATTDADLGLIAQAADAVRAAATSGAALSSAALSSAATSADARTALLLVGSGGLAAQQARHWAASRPAPTPPELGPVLDHALIVVGSYSGAARAQVGALIESGVTQVRLDHAALDDSRTRLAAASALRAGHVVLTPDHAERFAAEHAPNVARALGRVAAGVLDSATVLIIAGGETARATLDQLNVRHLRVLAELQPGVVLSELQGREQRLITKAGAFGGERALAEIVTGHAHPFESEDF